MILLSSLIDQFETSFLEQYHDSILPSHRNALNAMKTCRTTASAQMLAQCSECDKRILFPHSCGHRSCAHCQHHESQQWLERQLQKLVPAPYFLLTFTLPQQFRSLAWQHQRIVYDLMTRCAWETVHRFALNDRQLQGTPGATTVLHTHSRRGDFHPHVHLVMPAAAIDDEARLWRTKADRKAQSKDQGGYLFSHKALATVFRAKLLEALAAQGLQLPASYPRSWVVDVTSVGTGEKALVYLGRYLYRGVIQETDIIACEDGQVTFRYLDSKTDSWKNRTVSGPHFLWLIVQHVLPKGFRRARNYGFLHPNRKRLIALLQWLLKINPAAALAQVKQRPALRCPDCGAKMKIIATRIRFKPPNRQTMPVPIM